MRRSRSPSASVQQGYVHLREIAGDMLCLASPTTATSRRSYRAVVEVSAINFTLTSEEEQEAIIAGYRAFLKALTFPIQVLVRNQRLDLRTYLQRVGQQAALADRGRADSTWSELAHSLLDFITKMAAQHMLIERHFYIIIPLSPESGQQSLPFFSLAQLPGRRQRIQQAAASENARQNLDVQVEMVLQQLTALGLHCRRLRGEELAVLYHSCLTPERALRHPLTSAYLAGVGRPHKVKTSRPGTHNKQPSPVLSARSSKQQHPQVALEAVPASPTTTTTTKMALPVPDLLHLADLLAPASVEVFSDALCVEGEFARGLAITAFPREVSLGGWLAPLVLHDDIADLVWHFHPQDSAAMLRQLKRRRAGYVAARHFNQRQGRLDDPEMAVAQEDVASLLGQVASGEERLFDLGFYILVRATDRHSLQERSERMMAVLNMLLLDSAAHPTTFEHAQAFRSCLPTARDELRRTVTLDSTTLATAFPFISNSLSMPGGVLLGMTDTGEPVLLNAWDETLENPHAFIGGVTGAGKSYLGKLLIERDLLLHGARGRPTISIHLTCYRRAVTLPPTCWRRGAATAWRKRFRTCMPCSTSCSPMMCHRAALRRWANAKRACWTGRCMRPIAASASPLMRVRTITRRPSCATCMRCSKAASVGPMSMTSAPGCTATSQAAWRASLPPRRISTSIRIWWCGIFAICAANCAQWASFSLPTACGRRSSTIAICRARSTLTKRPRSWITPKVDASWPTSRGVRANATYRW